MTENTEGYDFLTDEQREAYEQRKAGIEAVRQQSLEDKLAEYRDIKQELGPFLDRLKALEKDIKEHVKDTGEVAEIQGARIVLGRAYTRDAIDRVPFLDYARNKQHLHKFIKTISVSPAVKIQID